MKCEVSAPNGLNGAVTIPASKSYAHRILIACALADEPTLVKGLLTGADIKATADCLTCLGAKFKVLNLTELMVFPINRKEVKAAVLNASESGSTLRFLLPVAACLGAEATFTGEGRLGERPIGELINALAEHGVSSDKTSLPLTIKNKPTGGIYKLSGGISSQFITGLLLALPLLEEDSIIEIDGGIVSQSYVEITLETLEKFGIAVKKDGNIFYIKGGQSYISPKKITVEGDWSNACFFAVGGAVNGSVTLSGLNNKSTQGDSVIIALLGRMGAKITSNSDGMTFSKGNLNAIEFSAEDCPDIVPAMSIAMANAAGVSKIRGVERLRIKESDRLEAVLKMLEIFNVKTEYERDLITIYGGKITGADITGFNDHRMAMSEAIASCGISGKVVVGGAEAVNKSYPQFFEDFKKLGGKVNVL